MRFEEKLIQLRKEKGWSQERLASELGVTRQAVSRWESGVLPDANNLIQLSTIFNVSIDYLIKDEVKPIKMNFSSHSNMQLLMYLIVYLLIVAIMVIINNQSLYIIGIICSILLIYLAFFKDKIDNTKNKKEKYEQLGNFAFYSGIYTVIFGGIFSMTIISVLGFSIIGSSMIPYFKANNLK